MEKPNKPMPRINISPFEGTPIDQLPVSYCRWMLMQDFFPREWMEIAKAKVDASPIHNEPIFISRHALDRFSIRFLREWTEYKFTHKAEYDGIATFLVKRAKEAWEKGNDVSKKRHRSDGIVKQYKGIKYVFNQSRRYPEYLELITVM